jgi:hypothetical protein
MIPFVEAWASSDHTIETDLYNSNDNSGNSDTIASDGLLGWLLGGDDDEEDKDEEEDEEDEDDEEEEADDEDDNDDRDDDSGDNRPDAYNQSTQTDEDTSVEIILHGDADDDDSITFAISDQPQNGRLSSLDESNGTVTYEPSADFHGSDSFSFTVSDGKRDSRPATVSILVISVNDPPLAVGASITTDEGESVSIKLEGRDVDDSDLEFSIVSGPSHGSISGTAPALRYEPDKRYDGSDSFLFKVSDRNLESGAATIQIKVRELEDENEEDESDRWWENPVQEKPDASETTQTDDSLDIVTANDTSESPSIVQPSQPTVPMLTVSSPSLPATIPAGMLATPANAAVSIPPVQIVGDVVAPRLILPADLLSVFATSEEGAEVMYTVRAVDDVDGEVQASCAPGSGSTLPVGKFNIVCKATDAAGNSVLDSFIVVVRETSTPLAAASPSSFLFPALLIVVLGAGTVFGLRSVVRRLHRQ